MNNSIVFDLMTKNEVHDFVTKYIYNDECNMQYGLWNGSRSERYTIKWLAVNLITDNKWRQCIPEDFIDASTLR